MSSGAFAAGKVEQTASKQKGVHKDARVSQKKINKLDDETTKLIYKYRQTLKKIENAKIYNEQLKKLIAQQNQEKVDVAAQIESLKNTNEGIFPLMLKMVSTFKEFVSLDVPFLPEERAKRVADLETLMDRADVSTSEKFRRVLEAYQVENEYGRTIEAYRGIVAREGKEMTVDFLRLGRIGLFYQSLDSNISAIWNPGAQKWDDLDSDYRRSLKQGLAMARKQRAPSLLKLPVPAAAQSAKGAL